MPTPVEFGDIQGLVRFGHGHLTEARYLMLEIADARAARAWLAAAPVTSAEVRTPRPECALQVAFTADGLRALDLSAEMLGGFSPEFLSGLAGEPSRSRRLGDVGASAPVRWSWGAEGDAIHLLVMLFACGGGLEDFARDIQNDTWRTAFRVRAVLGTSDQDGVEPFGFRDGVSQPVIDWERAREVDGADQLPYGNVAALGEFVLGYPNEYGKYTDRPLLASASDPDGLLPAAEDQTGLRDLGRNGSYLVFRQLHQDVRLFWRYLDGLAQSDPAERERWAEAIVGRRRDGTPLVAAVPQPIAGVGPDGEDDRLNRFTYDSDPGGKGCPFGAHIRRANPRNGDLPAGTSGLWSWLLATLGFGNDDLRTDLVAATRYHRLLRRGREYGPGLTPEQAIAPEAGTEEPTGLHFICLNANIARQFEFVQNAWINGTKFDGLTEESDPLLGTRGAIAGCRFASGFTRPDPTGLPRRAVDLPQFVTVVGGGYFFLPGLRALRYLAAAPWSG